MATLDQGREGLDPSWTLGEALTGGRGDTLIIRGQSRHVVGYMRDFLFAPEQVRTPLGVLSGGERGRLMLARALAKPSNLLVLDEPTNDLDLETLDVLEEMIGDYAGTVILISHDRDFLDRTVNAVIMSEGDGRWTEYAGGYSDMLAQRGQAVASRKPARPKPAADGRSAPPAPEPKPGKRRLSFHEKHALETLPQQIAALQGRIGSCNSGSTIRISMPAIGRTFAELSGSLAAAQLELSSAEEKWLRAGDPARGDREPMSSYVEFTALGFAPACAALSRDPGRTAARSVLLRHPIDAVDQSPVRPLPARPRESAAVLQCRFEENGMPDTEKFMADLLAIIASTEQSEDQQIDAATKLAVAYTAGLEGFARPMDRERRAATRVSSARTRPSSRSRVGARRNPPPGACCTPPRTSSAIKRSTGVRPRAARRASRDLERN